GRPAARASAAGRVVEVLGAPGDPEADFRAIAWRHRLPIEFPQPVLDEAHAFAPGVAPEERARRLDLTARPFVTIDPATARDHDDAVCVEPGAAGGWRLWVAIADVSHFVAEGSALDREALRRGNSVYFPDRAIPMLPEHLSGDLCSLRPDTERLALAAELEIGGDGAVRGARFHEAVLRSRARLVYEEVADAMAEGPAREGEVGEQLVRLGALARRLLRRRVAGGAIDLDLPEPWIVLGDDGRPVDVRRAARTLAHRAIEEAMLAANRAVAEWLAAREVPALYRVHEPPAPAKLDALRALYGRFGLLEGARDEPLSAVRLAEALRRVEGHPEERLVNLATLRSMRQARYDARNLGHFALAFDAYLHFTSPIRRYADLVVHRALKDTLAAGGASRERAAARAPRVAGWAARASFCERAAQDAEREAVDAARCAYMAGHLGEEYEGSVTSVARQGAYVTLDPVFVEGLVHVSALPGRWDLEPDAYALVKRSGEALRLGDRLRVRIDRVDLARGWIDLGLVRRLS
nr:VacB/RNase II family 3'-5' exoribonuclease [Myxococcota bacterium]